MEEIEFISLINKTFISKYYKNYYGIQNNNNNNKQSTVIYYRP